MVSTRTAAGVAWGTQLAVGWQGYAERTRPVETLPLEVYSTASNFAVIKPPGRRFPGSVIQGDTLSNLVDRAREVVVGIRSGHVDSEVEAAASELLESLAARLRHYQHVLESEGVASPVGPRGTAAELASSDPPPPVAVTGWIYDSNLRPFLEATASLVGQQFDSDDWTAVRFGVSGADAEASRWYELSLPIDVGAPIALRVAPDVGSSIVRVELLAHFSLIGAIEHSIVIFQRLRFDPLNPPGARR